MPVALVRLLIERLGLARGLIVTAHSSTLLLDPTWMMILYPARGN